MNISQESVVELEAVIAEYEQNHGCVSEAEMAADTCDCKDAGCGRSCTNTCVNRCEGGCLSSCTSQNKRQ